MVEGELPESPKDVMTIHLERALTAWAQTHSPSYCNPVLHRQNDVKEGGALPRRKPHVGETVKGEENHEDKLSPRRMNVHSAIKPTQRPKEVTTTPHW